MRVLCGILPQTCEQVEHTVNTGNDEASYRVRFQIVPPNGEPVPDCYCAVKCAVGARFTDKGALEVGPPQRKDGTDYRGAWNQQEFSDVIGRYLPQVFRGLINVGPRASPPIEPPTPTSTPASSRRSRSRASEDSRA